MTLLSRIERGRTPMPPRILTYGIEGIGKSTFASESPQPIFIQTEDGPGQITC
ncbi:MAG: AAA family ATPase, partial [Pirellulaceae bacterium]